MAKAHELPGNRCIHEDHRRAGTGAIGRHRHRGGVFFGIALVLGAFTRPLALLFCLFTLGTAFLGHRYWKLEGAERHANMLNFYKNLSITGGLLLLAVTGPGRYALTGLSGSA